MDNYRELTVECVFLPFGLRTILPRSGSRTEIAVKKNVEITKTRSILRHELFR